MADILYTVVAPGFRKTYTTPGAAHLKQSAIGGHIQREIKCACGFTHELGRSDTTCCNCGQDYNACGDRLRATHCSDEHYEAAEYANG